MNKLKRKNLARVIKYIQDRPFLFFNISLLIIWLYLLPILYSRSELYANCNLQILQKEVSKEIVNSELNIKIEKCTISYKDKTTKEYSKSKLRDLYKN